MLNKLLQYKSVLKQVQCKLATEDDNSIEVGIKKKLLINN
jgi:hypothetical protein